MSGRWVIVLTFLMSLFSCVALMNMIVVEKLFPQQAFKTAGNSWKLHKRPSTWNILQQNLQSNPKIRWIQDKMASFRVSQPFCYSALDIFDWKISKQGQQSRQSSREPTRLWKGWIDQGGIPCPECQWLWLSQCGWNEAICWGHRYPGSYQVVSLIALFGVYGRLFAHVRYVTVFTTVCMFIYVGAG